MGEIGTPVPGNPIDDAGVVRQTVAMLFYGWGYNWYREENQLHAGDLLIRSKVSDYLQKARDDLAALESAYRARYLPPPSREHPLPDPAAVARTRLLHDAGESVGAVETRVRTAPVPENDKIWQRYRVEKDLLERLTALDTDLVWHAMLLADLVAKAPEQEQAGGLADRVRSMVGDIRSMLDRREEMLRI